MTDTTTTSPQRRYDVDWLRLLALMLLIVYHAAISFQPWGKTLFFPVAPVTSPALWAVMQVFNIWRIPILFFVSGAGVFFSLRRRNWQHLLGERALRLLVPLGFGAFVIVPGMLAAAFIYYGIKVEYIPDYGHLWFLQSIFIYTVMLLGVFVLLTRNPDNRLITWLRKLLRTPLGLVPLAVPFLIEAAVINPDDFTLYLTGTHGFVFGLLAFLYGFVLAATGDVFKTTAVRARFYTLAIANALYLSRVILFHEVWQTAHLGNLLTMVESLCWIVSCFGFAAAHLNHPSKFLRTAARFIFPIYIFHMPVQWWVSVYLLPLPLSNAVKFPVLVISTLGISTVLAIGISYIKPLRPLFGMRYHAPPGARTAPLAR